MLLLVILSALDWARRLDLALLNAARMDILYASLRTVSAPGDPVCS